MKALLINGSPNAKGCTFTALSLVAEELQKNGVEAEIVHVGHKNIHGCISCGKCHETGKCVFDDIVNEVAPKFEQADALIIGSPVYYAGIAGTMKSFLDRLFFSTHFDKRMKVGAAVCSARRSGTTATFDQLNKYFTISEMPIAASQYWNMVHGNTPEEVAKDEEGLQIMRVLGRNMAWLLKSIDAGKQAGVTQPSAKQKVYTNFIR
jgi:multimeric flavodoxin WrbA